MDGGAILFFLCLAYFLIKGDEGKATRNSEDVNQYDVLYGGDE